MVLHALEDVDDALAVTRAFLWPVDRTTWLKLAVVVFFVGGPGAGFNTVQYNVGGGGDAAPPTGELPEVGADIWLIVAAAVVAALLVGFVFALVGAIMEFVLVESLRSREVHVREYWGRRWGQGVRLFVFRLVIGLFVLGSVLLLSALFLLPLLGFGEAAAVPGVLALLLLVPVFVVLGLLVGIVNGFTTVFVVPIMVLEDCGVLAGWGRLWSSITGAWTQYLAYAVVGALLSIAGGLLVGLLTGLLAIVLLVPFGLLFALGIGLFTVAESLGIGLMVVTGLLFGLAVVVVAALVQVPVQTYLRYYALLVLGDVEESLDLVPDQRAAVRE